jgi:hypothetical protein
MCWRLARPDKVANLSDHMRSGIQKFRGHTFGCGFFDGLRRWVRKRSDSDYGLKRNTGFESGDRATIQLADEFQAPLKICANPDGFGDAPLVLSLSAT